MKYPCLVYQEQTAVDALPEAEDAALLADVLAYREELRQRGHDVASSPLAPVRAATTLCVQNDKVALTDDPFAETREQLGGYAPIDARDLIDAVRVATQMPSARPGCIETRPVTELDPG